MTRRDWRLIIIAFAILAILWTIGGFIAAENYRTIRDNQDRLESLSVNVTASICLQAFAPEEGDPDERGLVIAFVEDEPTPLTNETCRKAVEKSRRQVEGEEPD